MFPRKGIIAKGSDADIVVIDPKVKRVISAKAQYLVSGHNIWEGQTVEGVTVLTISQGNVVWRAHVTDGYAKWDQGKFSLENQERGRFISRPTGGFSYENIDNSVQKAIVRK